MVHVGGALYARGDFIPAPIGLVADDIRAKGNPDGALPVLRRADQAKNRRAMIVTAVVRQGDVVVGILKVPVEIGAVIVEIQVEIIEPGVDGDNLDTRAVIVVPDIDHVQVEFIRVGVSEVPLICKAGVVGNKGHDVLQSKSWLLVTGMAC